MKLQVITIAGIALVAGLVWQLPGGNKLAGAGLPRNPERPMVATTCRQALQRVREAALGSPLIDSEQNKKVLLDAIAQAERLCLDNNEDDQKIQS